LAGGRGFAGITEKPPAKPIIAAVEGYALAGGCEVALSCDMVVASTEAKFGVPEVKRGLAGITTNPPTKPMIAAIEGYALAGGCELALACDLIVASRESKFGIRRPSGPWSPARVACCGCPSASRRRSPWSTR